MEAKIVDYHIVYFINMGTYHYVHSVELVRRLTSVELWSSSFPNVLTNRKGSPVSVCLPLFLVRTRGGIDLKHRINVLTDEYSSTSSMDLVKDKLAEKLRSEYKFSPEFKLWVL